MMIKKLLSYFIPIIIHQKQSDVSKNLEVTWNNGNLVLDSKNTNYSYGSLQRVLRKGLKEINFEKIKAMKSVLVLGVAGGSVIKTLAHEIQYKGKITGVEIDADVIALANDYFKLNEIPGLEIIISDASAFVHLTKEKYDLIVIDIFTDTEMPAFLFEKEFLKRVGELVEEKGFILFNTMFINQGKNNRTAYLDVFDSHDFQIKKLSNIQLHNELIIIEKIA